MKQGFFQKNYERAMREGEGAADSLGKGFRHSTFYHRYFEDYSERRVVGADGKRRIERSYTGSWYERACTPRQWALTKLLYPLVGLAALAAFYLPYCLPLAVNRSLLVGVPCMLSAVGAVFLMLTLLWCVTAKRRMTSYEYRSGFHRLPLFCLIQAAVMALCALLAAFVLLTGAQRTAAEEWSPVLGSAAGAALLAALARFEKRTEYLRISSETVPAYDSVTIT